MICNWTKQASEETLSTANLRRAERKGSLVHSGLGSVFVVVEADTCGVHSNKLIAQFLQELCQLFTKQGGGGVLKLQLKYVHLISEVCVWKIRILSLKHINPLFLKGWHVPLVIAVITNLDRRLVGGNYVFDHFQAIFINNLPKRGIWMVKTAGVIPILVLYLWVIVLTPPPPPAPSWRPRAVRTCPERTWGVRQHIGSVMLLINRARSYSLRVHGTWI